MRNFSGSRTYAMPERSDHLDFYIRDQASRSAITETHKHEYFQIQINLGGDTEQHIGTISRPFPRGAVALILPHRLHRIPHPADSRFIVINFSQDFLFGHAPAPNEDPGRDARYALREPMLLPFLLQEHMDFVLDGATIDEVESLASRMLELDRRREFGDTVLLRGYLLQLIGTICSRHRQTMLALVAAGVSLPQPNSAFARIARHLRANLADPSLCVASVAELAALSPRSVSVLVKRETGKTFVQWLTQTRIDTAKTLLADPARQIKDVAFRVGYHDETYFTRRFRQITGLSPSEYRETHGVAR